MDNPLGQNFIQKAVAFVRRQLHSATLRVARLLEPPTTGTYLSLPIATKGEDYSRQNRDLNITILCVIIQPPAKQPDLVCSKDASPVHSKYVFTLFLQVFTRHSWAFDVDLSLFPRGPFRGNQARSESGATAPMTSTRREGSGGWRTESSAKQCAWSRNQCSHRFSASLSHSSSYGILHAL